MKHPLGPTLALLPLAALLLPALAVPVLAQDTPTELRDTMMRHFDGSARKMTMLSTAMPDELFTWSPGEGVMSVARVYAHIARYNYMYLEDNLGIPAPDDADLDRMEDVTDPAAVRELLARSIEHVRTHVPAMTAAELTTETTLYGRQVPGWAVLTQLVAHMNEHVGQSIAYARVNGVVPPWSR